MVVRSGLSLCSGIGGLELALRLALGSEYRTVCWVENDPFAAALLVARFQDGSLDEAPLWDDVTTFRGGSWRGRVDIISAGFPCFAAGTMVLTESGFRPIESLLVGERVLTHAGRWRPITAVMRRDAAHRRLIRAAGCTPIITTDEHPFLIRTKGRLWNQRRRSYDRVFSAAEWTDAQHLQVGDYVGQVLPPTEPDDHSLAFWWLVGRYLADGWRTVSGGKGRVVICCARGEADDIGRRIRDAGFNSTPSVEGPVVKFHITRRAFYDFLEPFGRYAGGKTLPKRALTLDPERTRALLEGLLTGDGYQDRDRAEWRLTTVSKSLALGTALLAQRTSGVIAGIRFCKLPDTTIIGGRRVRQQGFWVVSIPPRNREGFVEQDRGWKPVRSNEPSDGGHVWNISVAEDESYIADGAIVHNCQPHSTAGQRRGTADERWLWPDIARVLREVEPEWVFLENVPGLLGSAGAEPHGAMGEVLGSLAALGYDAEWGVFSAAEVGAPQLRERVFILARLADAEGERERESHDTPRTDPRPQPRQDAGGGRGGVAHAVGGGEQQPEGSVEEVGGWSRDHGASVADSDGTGRGAEREHGWGDADGRGGASGVADAEGAGQLRAAEPQDDGAHHARGGRQDAADGGGLVADTDGGGGRAGEHQDAPGAGQRGTADARGASAAVGDTPGQGREGWGAEWSGADERNAWPPGPAERGAWARILARRPDLAPATPVEPRVRGVVAGLSGGVVELRAPRTRRLRVLGNSVVPQEAAVALLVLAERLEGPT